MHELGKSNVVEYFASARERYEIYLKKEICKSPKPWTEDPVFLSWRFCNVFREDDKVTSWIRENVRKPYLSDPNVFICMVICRLFNKISTLSCLKSNGLFKKWNSMIAKTVLKGVKPVVGAAYVVRSPDGMSKLDGILKMIDLIAKDTYHLCVRIEPGETTLESVWLELCKYPCIGRFIAYEIISDLRWTSFLDQAPDIMTWANAGPGACRGLSWLVNNDYSAVPYSASTAVQTKIIDTLRTLLEYSQNTDFWPKKFPKWEMRDVEHWLCEYAKYARVKHLGERMKRKYDGITKD
ncbi:MAG: putative DNA base hypermodification protein [Desulfobacteraceae bacterium]|jgi:hypothetical protein